MYYRGAAAAIVVYDITVAVRFYYQFWRCSCLWTLKPDTVEVRRDAQESLLVAQKWRDASNSRVDKYARVDRVRELRAKGAPDMVIALAGNKLDLEVKRAVTKEASDHTMKFVHNAVPLRSLGAGALLVHTGGTTVCGRAEASVL
jgi:GTPase SAR1 family protein